MTDRPDPADPTASDEDRDVDPVAEVVPDPGVRTLAGFRDPDDEGELIGADEVDDLGGISDTEIYQGELEARTPDSDQPDDPVAENLELLTELELRADETDEPGVAAEEGIPWIPPTDPPTIPGERGDPQVAAGFGVTSTNEPYDLDHHASNELVEDERTERILEALRADAMTSTLVDRLEVGTVDDRVIVAGVVDDLDDEDAVLEVASRVAGVAEVVSEIRVASVE